MGSANDILRRIDPKTQPSGAIGWRASASDYEVWIHRGEPSFATTPEVPELGEWFGYINVRLEPMLSTIRGPPPIYYDYYKKFVEYWQHVERASMYPAFTWSDYKQMANWYLMSGNSISYTNELRSLQARNELSGPTFIEKKVLSQLLFTIELVMKDIRRVSAEIFISFPKLNPEGQWKVWPEAWHLEREVLLQLMEYEMGAIENLTSIQLLARRLKTPFYYAPPNNDNVVKAMIHYFGTYRSWVANEQAKRDPNRSFDISNGPWNWYPIGGEGACQRYLEQTFPQECKMANLMMTKTRNKTDMDAIKQGEPFGRWVGVFIQRIMFDLYEEMGPHILGDWNVYWPKAIARYFDFDMTIEDKYLYSPRVSSANKERQGAASVLGIKVISMEEDPTRFFPNPNDMQATFLTILAQSFAAGKGKITAHSADIETAISCYVNSNQNNTSSNVGFYPLPLAFGDQYPRIDYSALQNRNSNELDKVKLLYGGLLLYAIGLQKRIANRPREQWEWDKSGISLHGTNETKYNECKRLEENAITHIDSPTVCDAQSYTGWEKPWLLRGKDLENFINAKAPMPGKKNKELLRGDYDYNLAWEQSLTDYHAWKNVILEHPEGLETYGIGSSKVDATTGKTIHNWYNDYGVWAHRERTAGETIAQFLWSPYQSLTGKTLLEELFKQGELILNFIRVQFKATAAVVTNVLEDFLKSGVFWPLIGGTALLIAVGVGTKEAVDRL